MRHNNIYKTLPIFMLRKSLLPIETIDKITDQNYRKDLLQLFKNRKIREAILSTSSSLFNSLVGLEKGEMDKVKEKKKKHIFLSLNKYVLRMCGRATPYSVLSSITHGQLNDEKCLVKMNDFKTRTRLDMDWLYSLINYLENNINVLNQLEVKWNHATQVVGDRFELHFPTFCGQADGIKDANIDYISIRITEPLLYLVKKSHNPIKYKTLVNDFCKKYVNEADKSILENYVNTVFQKEFLISELRPPLTVMNPMNFVLKKLNQLNQTSDEISFLNNIISMMKKYDDCLLGSGDDDLQLITKTLKKRFPKKNVVQIDSFYPHSDISIPEKVGKDVAEASEILFRISSQGIGLPDLKEYYLDFIEKYGLNEDVPLLQLINSETGLGFPKAYSNDNTTTNFVLEKNRQKIIERDNILKLEIQKLIRHKGINLNLDDDLIDKLVIVQKENKYATNSFEVFGEVLTSSLNDMKNGKYQIILNPTSGSYQAGISFGRFSDVVSPQTGCFLNDLTAKREKNNKDILLAEGSFVPQYGRTGNIMVTNNPYKFELALGNWGNPNSNQLDLNDLYIAANENNLFIKSKKYNKEVVIMASHMLNFSNSPKLYRFLRELSFENQISWQPFDWGSLVGSPFLPRVTYKNVVLSPALWNIYDYNLSNLDRNNWNDDFRKLAGELNIPDKVYLEYADNRILLNLNKAYSLEILRKDLVKNKSIKLREFIGEFSDRGFISQKVHYTTECVFQIEKKQNTLHYGSKFRSINLPSKKEIVPLDSWVYLKIYIGKNLQDSYICSEIKELINYLFAHKLIDAWFFIRYEDPEPHIRFRIHFSGQSNSVVVISKLVDWMKQCTAGRKVKRFTIDTYDRETERYGGSKLIPYAEKVFFSDSNLCLQVLSLVNTKKVSLLVLGILDVINMLRTFGMEYTEISAFLTKLTKKNTFKKEYRKIKKDILENICNKQINNLFNYRAPSITSYRNKYSTYSTEASNDFDNILASLLHMTCNRLYGVNRTMEEKTVSMAGYAAKDWANFKQFYV